MDGAGANDQSGGETEDDRRIRLDAAFLADVHLGDLPVPEANLLLTHIYETLEMRVGIRLASAMSQAQLDEFEAMIDAKDEDAALRWLGTFVPEYKAIVRGELDLLRAEIRQIAPAILEMSGLPR